MSSPTYSTTPILNPLMDAVVDQCLGSAFTNARTSAYTSAWNDASIRTTTLPRALEGLAARPRLGVVSKTAYQTRLAAVKSKSTKKCVEG